VFKTWNIIDSLLTDYTTGHQLWEPRMLAGELNRRGIETRVFGHISIKADDFPGARSVPVFPLHYGEIVSQDPSWRVLETFIVHNRSYEEALNKVDRSLFDDALALFPNMSARHLLGVLRWLDRYDDWTRPKTAMILMARRDWSETSPALWLYRKVWGECPPALKDHIKLCVRTEISAREYERVLGIRPHVLPSSLGPTEREIAASHERIGPPRGPMAISFLAGARVERGTTIVPAVVKECASLDVRFLFQVTDAWELPDKAASFKALREQPGVQLHEGILSREDYNDWIAQSVVLLPYEAAAYKWRSSGVYLEAKCFGAPVIVPAGTWMAEEVTRLGNGVVFEEYTARSIAASIARAQAELNSLRARAAACAVEYRRHHGADRCIDAIDGLFQR
jgi:hypothetical protein